MDEYSLLQTGRVQQRFAALHIPEPTTGCYLWLGTSYRGRAHFQLATRRTMFAARAAYQIYCGPIPSGLKVLHRCDFPMCVNPDHLFLGTQRDNMRDKSRKGRHPRYVLTPEQAAEIIALKDSAPPQHIADRYGVGRSLIRGIWNGKNWPHLPR